MNIEWILTFWWICSLVQWRIFLFSISISWIIRYTTKKLLITERWWKKIKTGNEFSVKNTIQITTILLSLHYSCSAVLYFFKSKFKNYFFIFKHIIIQIPKRIMSAVYDRRQGKEYIGKNHLESPTKSSICNTAMYKSKLSLRIPLPKPFS